MTKKFQGFCHDSLLHVCDRASKMAIFGLEFYQLSLYEPCGLSLKGLNYGLLSTCTCELFLQFPAK